jgi:hypothetical protein
VAVMVVFWCLIPLDRPLPLCERCGAPVELTEDRQSVLVEEGFVCDGCLTLAEALAAIEAHINKMDELLSEAAREPGISDEEWLECAPWWLKLRAEAEESLLAVLDNLVTSARSGRKVSFVADS